MARIEGVSAKRAGWWVRVADWAARRRLGRSVEPVRILGHSSRLLFGVGAFEWALDGAAAVPSRLKELAQIRAATLVGCPF